jgi:hypothetical protein
MDTAIPQQKPKGGSMRIIRNVYLYLVTLIGLITFVFGAVGIIDGVLQHYVFQVDQSSMYSAPATVYPGNLDQCSQSYPDKNDSTGKTMIYPTTQQVTDCRAAQAAQDKKVNDSNFFMNLSTAIAQIVIGLPLWLFHWGIIQGEYKKREQYHEI